MYPAKGAFMPLFSAQSALRQPGFGKIVRQEPVSAAHHAPVGNILPIRLKPHDYHEISPVLAGNFLQFGQRFGASSPEEYSVLARELLEESLRTSDPDYVRIRISRSVISVDYKGQRRGFYTSDGHPLAFFRPDYRLAGYNTPREERDAWLKSGKVIGWVQ